MSTFNSTLQQIFVHFQKHITLVNNELISISRNEELVSKVLNDIISSGGKRIRPILLFLSASTCTSEKNILDNGDITKTAAIIELIHTASLLHDDVIDEAKLRRGKQSPNVVWGNKEVILVGDYLFAKSFEMISNIKTDGIASVLSKACVELTLGELMQLNQRKHNRYENIQDGIDAQLNIIYKKTASLFEVSTMIGAMITSSSHENILLMAECGKNIGMAFQIIDDILDYTSTDASFKKAVGTDFAERKITLPIAYCLDNDRIYQYFTTDSGNLSFDEAKAILQKTGALDKAKSLSRNYLTMAEKQIDNVIKNIAGSVTLQTCNNNASLLMQLVRTMKERDF